MELDASFFCTISIGVNCILLTRRTTAYRFLKIGRFVSSVLLSCILLAIAILDGVAPPGSPWQVWANQNPVFTIGVSLLLTMLALQFICLIVTICVINSPRAGARSSLEQALEIIAVCFPFYMFAHFLVS